MTENQCPNTRQVRRIVVGHEYAKKLFSERLRTVNGLPNDAEFVRAYEQPSRQAFVFVFQSATFSPVEEGEEMPKYDIAFEEIPEYHTKPKHNRD